MNRKIIAMIWSQNVKDNFDDRIYKKPHKTIFDNLPKPLRYNSLCGDSTGLQKLNWVEWKIENSLPRDRLGLHAG